MEKLVANSRLNLSELKFSDKVVSFDSAVKGKTFPEFSEDVVLGRKSIHITNAEKDYVKKCVKLEIYYEQL